MSLLEPSSIAVVGASSQEGKVGHDILKNLVTQGYKGAIYPINPKGGEILGKTAYVSLADVPDAIDVAVIVTPAQTVIGLIDECGKKGIKNVIVISAGFGEIGTEEGKAREKELADAVRRNTINLTGPNCLGILRPAVGMNASFALELPPRGGIALLSQSGAFAVALMDSAKQLHMGFSTIVSMGNKATMDECDFLEMCETDPETKVIGLYLESIKDGLRFRDLARRITPIKPIVLIKSGTTEHGKQAVSSHTGALAGSEAGIDAVCRQCGIRRAETTEEFVDGLRALSAQPPLVTTRIAIITNAGGPGILATDAAGKARLQLPALQDENGKALAALLPPAASIHNPIDVLGDAKADRYIAAVAAAAKDPSIDGIVVVLTPQVMTPCLEIAKGIVETMKVHSLIPITASFMGAQSVSKAVAYLNEHGIPTYETPERAVRSLATLQAIDAEKKNDIRLEINKERAAKAAEILQEAHGLLSEEATQWLFALYELPIPRQTVVTTEEEAVSIAVSLGYPIVAKISSPDILHKTDIGGVRANLQTEEEVRRAYTDILANTAKHAPTAHVTGVLIQKFLPAGNEFIVGTIKDPIFGTLLLAGLGGIYTELFRDTSFRIAPSTEKEGYEMLQDLKSWKLLLGMRGKKQSDIDALVRLLLQTTQLTLECPQISAIDFNPVLIDENGVTIADAKVILE